MKVKGMNFFSFSLNLLVISAGVVLVLVAGSILLDIIKNNLPSERNLFLILAIRESDRKFIENISKSLDKQSCNLLLRKVKYIYSCSNQDCDIIWTNKKIINEKDCRETDFFLVKIKLDPSVSSIDFRNKAKSLIDLEEALSQLVGNATVEEISKAVDPEIIDRYFTKVG